MHDDDLTDRLHRLSTDVERVARTSVTMDVRRRGNRRRTRTAVGAVASASALAVAAPLVISATRAEPSGNDLTTASTTSSPAVTGTVTAPTTTTPSPTPSLGWDDSVRTGTVNLDALMSECMDGRNFPWMADSMTAAPEDIATYGLRISTVLEGDQSLAEGTSVPVDPITQARNSLPVELREAFDAAVDDCMNQAAADAQQTPPPTQRAIVVPGDDEGAFSVMFPATASGDGYSIDYEDTVKATVEADPRLVAATERWSSCMAGKRYDAESLAALREQIRQQTQPFREAYEAGLPADERGNDAPKSRSLEEVLTAEQLAGLRNLQAAEIAAAQASASCDDEINELLPVVWQDKLDEYLGYTG